MSDRDALIGQIKDKAVIHGTVTLSSGKEADYYVDMRRITLDGTAAPLPRLPTLAAQARAPAAGRRGCRTCRAQ